MKSVDHFNLCGVRPQLALPSYRSIVRTGLFLACSLLALLLPLAMRAQNIINTIAGGGNPLISPNPLNVLLGNPTNVVEDLTGNIYVSSRYGRYVFKVNTTNQISILAGTGYSGLTATVGGPATATPLTNPQGLALDATGSNLFITTLAQVFEVSLATGVLTNFAGTVNPANPQGGFGGDGGPATQALLNQPRGVAVFGNTVYIADTNNNRVRAVTGGVITTFAGNGTPCSDPTGSPACGDGGPATQATLKGPRGVAVDTLGNVYIADSGDNRIRMVSSGIITTVAGDGSTCNVAGCGDGGPATSAEISGPSAVFIDPFGDIYIADQNDSLVRFVNADSQDISTIAGGGSGGDGSLATQAALHNPSGVFVDATGNLLIAEQSNDRIREVNTNQIISTIVGGGSGGDNQTALNAVFVDDYALVLDASGNQFIVDRGANRVREITAATQVITTVVGSNTGLTGGTGDGGPATNATLDFPEGIAMDTAGDLFIADEADGRVRLVQGGVISTYAGVGGSGACNPTSSCGDGGPATGATFNQIEGVAVDLNGNLYITDTVANRVRKVDTTPQHIITTVAGTGNSCPVSTNACGDGGPATQANLNGPEGVVVDAAGNVFIADSNDNRIRKIDAVTQTISTVAFNGQPTFSGDGGSATSAAMQDPQGLAIDSAGNLFVASLDRVRRVDAATQTVATVAGNTAPSVTIGFSGDGGPATAATLTLNGVGVAINATGGLYIADAANNRIRFVQLSPTTALAPANLNFGNQSAGVASSPLPVTVTNSGSDDLLITSISDAAGFSQTNNCPIAPKPLAPLQTCTINVTFTPTSAGNATSTLVITDNAPGSPHSIPLTGVGVAPFSLTSNCTSLTVVPGQTAIYTVALTPAKGFTKSVSLSCSGAPALATCTVNPNKITLDGANTVQAKVTATTTPATSGFLQWPFGQRDGDRLAGLVGLAGMLGLAALVVLPGKRGVKQARGLWGLVFCLCMLSTMATMSSCGGGGAGADPPGTAAGTYPLTVTATFQSSTGAAFTEKVSFDLVVQ